MPQNESAAKLREIWKVARDSVVKLATPEGATEPDLHLIRDSFHDEFTDLYDEINSAAFNAGSGKQTDKLTKANAKLKELTDELAEKEAALSEALSKTPDVERVKKDFERQMAKVVGEKDEKIGSLSEQLSTMRQDRDLGAFEKDLIQAGFKPRAAASYRAIHAKDFEYDDEGKPVVKQPETGVPFIVAKGAPWSPLVKQLREKADPDDVAAAVDVNGAGAIRRGFGAQAVGVAGRGQIDQEEANNKKKAISYGI